MKSIVFPMNMYPVYADREAWARVPEKVRQEAAELAEECRRESWPLRLASGIMAFRTNGSRKADENPFFQRRRRLVALALNMLIQGDDKDLTDILDGLFLICEETTWAISAHLDTGSDPLPDVEKPMLDLFAAQSGMIIALCRQTLGEEIRRVSPNLYRRLEWEIRRRVLDPFMNRDDFWWMGNNERTMNNWTPWILGNVLTCAGTVLDRDAFMPLFERALRIRDRFLRDMPEDGVCDEGAAYWNVSGGALLEVLQWQEWLGDEHAYDVPKIRNMLTYPARAYLGHGCFVNFADCDFRPWISPETVIRCGNRTGDAGMLRLGEELRRRVGLKAYVSDTVMFRRMLDACFPEEAHMEGAGEPKDIYYPSTQLRILEKGSWTLAVKGGHNEESHNHNDVGAFILFSGDDAVIADSGNMTYTAKTFSDARYTLFNTRSRNHSVPMPFGLEQKSGRAYGASAASCLPDGLEIEYAAAYGDPRLTRLTRRAGLDDTCFTLEDTLECTEDGFVDFVFLSRPQPEKTGAGFRLGPVLLEDDGSAAWQIEEIPVEDARMAKSYPGKLYRMSVRRQISKGTNAFRFCFRYLGEDK